MRLAAVGDIAGALGIQRQVTEASGDPEDRLFLGKLAYVATDFRESQVQLAAPIRAIGNRDRRGERPWPRLRLALCTSTAWRNRRPVAANLPRAIRLVEREDPCVEKGYAVVGAMGASVASAEELELSARLALELVHHFQDRNLECKALGDSGLALLSRGRVQDGMTRLDEAFAMIVGGDCQDPSVISQVVCGMLVFARTGGGNVNIELGERMTGASSIAAKSGAGNVTVHVPSNLLSRVHARTGFGKVTVDSHFERVGSDTYESPGYDGAVDRVEVTLTSAAGNGSLIINQT